MNGNCQLGLFFHGSLGQQISSNGDVMPIIRQQSILVTENTLKDEVSDNCFIRSICFVGTMDKTEAPRFSMVDGTRTYIDLLHSMISDRTIIGSEMIEETFPNIHKVLSSHTIGRDTRSKKMCASLFPCSMPVDATVQVILKPPMRHGRATCKAAGTLCPGVSIGCALCGIFSPGTCGTQCIVAGLYCGVSGYACKVEQMEAPTQPTDSTTTTKEHVDLTEFMFGPRYT
ncbi:uncharacterized protein LOC131891056 isoform X2 [Tigriopus californicus]|uniref:uncharacterized protein LOC131891056 isoform X2 n=1 Tax=Tigriopus californicus TaxID=6832 RepID=UPI0027DA0EB4|nr:uncharacterized protein LOC131891056 isoform X2 [Tigriopus californicus]